MEGEVTGKELTVTTTEITRKSGSKPPKVLKVRYVKDAFPFEAFFG